MQIPLEITYRHLEASAAIDAAIREKVAKLERFGNDLIGCRVTVEASHHQGRQYQVHISLQLPGSVINVSHDTGNKAHEDFYVALRDAFDAARRQLEDHMRVRRGDVKTPHTPAAVLPE